MIKDFLIVVTSVHSTILSYFEIVNDPHTTTHSIIVVVRSQGIEILPLLRMEWSNDFPSLFTFTDRVQTVNNLLVGYTKGRKGFERTSQSH